jgi:O-succinylbenzoic acid--CoA ligase
VRELVALDLPGGEGFLEALQRAWAAGDAVAPIDQRLATPAKRRLLKALAPTRVVTSGENTKNPGGRRVEEGDALVVATSGSTGEPKGAVLTYQAVAASAQATSARLGVDPGRHRWLACLPLSHIGGLSVVTRALLTGTELEVLPRFDPSAVMERASPATLVSLVPTALRRVQASAFHTVLLGGAAPPKALPANVVTTYGMTETASGVVYDGVPLPGAEVALSPSSEILLRGPMLFRAYRDGTAPFLEGGWFATGDAGHFDAGRLHVDGRISDLVVTGGENVWPVAVEAVLSQHPGVREVAVSSRPDPEWGERLVACVVPERWGEPPTLEELRDMAKAALYPWAAPKELVVLERLPKTALGKLRRGELRRQLQSGRAL